MMYQGNNAHKNSLDVGLEFQDFIAERLIRELGIPLTYCTSRKYQYNVGENIQGVEIKYDARSTGCCAIMPNTPTGNVAIEVAEKTKASNDIWVDSGIFRNDNTWLYIVGNYDCAWIFDKKYLRRCAKSEAYRIKETLPTIKTMLIPVKAADEICAKKLVFNDAKLANNIQLELPF
jgi:hypothetical protein